MNLPNRQAWSIATPHAPDCWCQFCFFHRLERVEAETELALRRTRAAAPRGRAEPKGSMGGDRRD